MDLLVEDSSPDQTRSDRRAERSEDGLDGVKSEKARPARENEPKDWREMAWYDVTSYREDMMPADKIAITLDRDLVKEIDRGVRSGLYRNRSRAIEEAVREKLDRSRRSRLAVEARKLDRKEERALAEEGMTGEETTWPEY